MIRLAEKSDLLDLYRMIEALATFERIANQVRLSQADLEAILFSEPPKAHALLCFQDNKPAGYSLLVPCLYVKRAKPKLVMEDLYVDETFRGQGIGKQLMQAVIDFAKDRGFFKVEWGVYKWNNKAHDFYKSAGVESGSGWTGHQIVLTL